MSASHRLYNKRRTGALRWSARFALSGPDASNISTVDIAAIKLERGDVSTLLADPPQNYGVEFLKCARYQFVLNGFVRFPVVFITSDAIQFCIPVPMRIRPEIVGSLNVAVGGTAQNGFEFSMLSVADRDASILMIKATKTGHGLAGNNNITLYISTGSFCIFDANF